MKLQPLPAAGAIYETRMMILRADGRVSSSIEKAVFVHARALREEDVCPGLGRQSLQPQRPILSLAVKGTAGREKEAEKVQRPSAVPRC